MRTRSSLIPALVLAVAGLYVGCSSTTEPPSTNNGTNVTFTQNSQFTSTEQRRDTTGGPVGFDQIDANSTDSVHSTVIDTNGSAYGKTHVVVIYNQRSRNPNDTTYIWQDGSGNLYRYNFGADILNNIPAVSAALGHRLEVGWVLQAKMTASDGAGWVAARDTESVNFGGIPATVIIKDSATRIGDTTITVSGSSVTAVHTLHAVSVELSSLPVTTVRIDNYEAKQSGEVRNTVHTFTVTIPLQPAVQVSGQERVMVSKQ